MDLQPAPTLATVEELFARTVKPRLVADAYATLLGGECGTAASALASDASGPATSAADAASETSTATAPCTGAGGEQSSAPPPRHAAPSGHAPPPAGERVPRAPRAIAVAAAAAVLLALALAAAATGRTPGQNAVNAMQQQVQSMTLHTATALAVAVALPILANTYPPAGVFGYWHIANTGSQYLGTRWHAPMTGTLDAWGAENAFYASVVAAAGIEGFTFNSEASDAQKLDMWSTLVTCPRAICFVARQALTPWLAAHAYAQATALAKSPWRPFIMTPASIDNSGGAITGFDDAGWSLSAQQQGVQRFQVDAAYGKGVIATPDCMSRASAGLCGYFGLPWAASGDSAEHPTGTNTFSGTPTAYPSTYFAMHVPYLIFAVGAWQLGNMALAKILFDRAFPHLLVGVINFSMFVSGHAWLTLTAGPINVCIVVVLVSILSRTIVPLHTNGVKGALRIGVGTGLRFVCLEDHEGEGQGNSGDAPAAAAQQGGPTREGLAGALSFGTSGGATAQLLAQRTLREAGVTDERLVRGGGLVLAATRGAAGVAALAGASSSAGATEAELRARFVGMQREAGEWCEGLQANRGGGGATCTLREVRVVAPSCPLFAYSPRPTPTTRAASDGGTVRAIMGRMRIGGALLVYEFDGEVLRGWKPNGGVANRVHVMTHDLTSPRVAHDLLKADQHFYFNYSPLSMDVTSSGPHIRQFKYKGSFTVAGSDTIAKSLASRGAKVAIDMYHEWLDTKVPFVA